MTDTLAIVTGGSDGIGAELLQRLAAHQPVLNISRRKHRVEDVRLTHPLYQLNVDLEDPEAALKILDNWLSDRPQLKASKFFSCAAQLAINQLNKVSAEEFSKLMVLNSWSPLAITEMLISRGHLATSNSRFVFVTSSLARAGDELSFARLGLYSASKAALGRLVEVQRREMSLGAQQISSTLVHPGIVATAMQDELRNDLYSDPAFREKTSKLPAFREGDWDERRPSMPELSFGDRVVFGMAGAYASSMGSGFSGVARPAEYLLRNGSIEAL